MWVLSIAKFKHPQKSNSMLHNSYHQLNALGIFFSWEHILQTHMSFAYEHREYYFYNQSGF